ncbi:MAG: alpha/beta fold hydrolase [Betaproteobacteria bacterium]|nr:alpha/beta fold hydrolase [Betaproteobacteria bacterium]
MFSPKSKLQIIALSSMTIALLTACGGGGGSGAGSATSSLSGNVIDGYIEGAKVCLDVNSNGACDTGEPTATTDSAGKYQLIPGSINTTGLNVIAEIPDTAKDSDDGGRTLLAAGKSAYTMVAPAAESSVVTPITTLIVGKVKTDNLSTATAKVRVLEELGLPSDTNPYADHVAAGNAIVHGVARQLAAQLQQAQKDLPTGTTAQERLAKLQEAIKTIQDSAGSIALESQDANPLNMPLTLSTVATGRLFAYKMPSAVGKQINASAMLFTPKSVMPPGGWPLLVFGHGTEGVAKNCAPSVTMKATGDWGYSSLVAALVFQGYVVVAPDYEGMGSTAMGVDAGHPYLDLGSAGRSMALAAVGAKKLMTTQLSGAWATLGHSQGGHAALAGAQFAGLAKKQEPSLVYKGAVAIAPASNLKASLNAMWSGIQTNSQNPVNYATGYEAVGISNFYAAYVVKGTQSTPSPLTPSNVFGARMLPVYSAKAGTECFNDFSTSISSTVNTYRVTIGATPAGFTGVINTAINSAFVSSVLDSNEPGQMKLPGNTLLVQGLADTTVLPSSTQALLATMQSKGSQVTLSSHSGVTATHGGVLTIPAAQAAINNHLHNLFFGN